MTTELAAPQVLAARARRPAILACALTAAVLAPLVDWLLVEEVLRNGADPWLADVVASAVWAPVEAAVLGGVVALLALHVQARPWIRVAATLGVAAVGGVLQLGLVMLAALPGEVARRGVEGLEGLAGAVMFGTIGSIVSAPMGAAFGALFLLALAPAAWSSARPSHDGPAWVWLAGAALLAVGFAVSLVLLHHLEDPYCQALLVVSLPSLGVHLGDGWDLAWTRYLLASPLAAGSLLFVARSLWLHLALARSVVALRRDVHPRWRIAGPTEVLSTDDVAPLFAFASRTEAGDAPLAVVAREATSPYRGQATPLASIASASSGP